MAVDFDRTIKDAEREGLVQGGDRFKIQEGANRIRLMTVPLPHQGDYKGTPNFKWLCYVLDRADGQFKTFFMPHTIFKNIRDLQKSDDYGFKDIPMPYDVTINALHAGTKDVDYTVVPARANKDLAPEEIAAFAKKKPIEEVKRAIREKEAATKAAVGAIEAREETPTSFDPDEVPF